MSNVDQNAERKRLAELRRLQSMTRSAKSPSLKNNEIPELEDVKLEDLNEEQLNVENVDSEVIENLKSPSLSSEKTEKSDNYQASTSRQDTFSETANNTPSSIKATETHPKSTLDKETHRRRRKVYLATEEFNVYLAKSDKMLDNLKKVFYFFLILTLVGIAGKYAPLDRIISMYMGIAAMIGVAGCVLTFASIASGEKKLCDMNEVIIDGYDYVLSEEWTKDSLRLMARKLSAGSKKK